MRWWCRCEGKSFSHPERGKLLHHQVVVSLIQIISVRRSSMQITARNQLRSRQTATVMQIE